jgi:hypothetical protein
MARLALCVIMIVAVIGGCTTPEKQAPITGNLPDSINEKPVDTSPPRK